MVEKTSDAVSSSQAERRHFFFLPARALRLEVLLVGGLLGTVGGVIWAVLRLGSGTGPLTEVNSLVIKELLDNLKIMLGALISWGTIIINGFTKNGK